MSAEVIGFGEMGSIEASAKGPKLLSLINRTLHMARQDGIQDPRKAMQHYRQQVMVQRIDAAQANRRDSFNPNAGFHMTRDLEHVYADVLREEYAPQTAMTLFPVDTSVSPGARTHTISRIYQNGEWGEYRSGQEIGRVGVSKQEESFPVVHYASSFGYDLFENLSSGFANTNLAAELLRTCRDIGMEFLNRRTWFGAPKFLGVLNYPWLNKIIFGTPANADNNDDTKKAAHVEEVLAMWDRPKDETFSTFSPNTLAASGRLIRYWQRTYFNDGSGDTIYKRITNTIPPGAIFEAPELERTGPGGYDGVLAYRRDRLGISNVMVQALTVLPQQEEGFESMSYCYMSHGGVIMRNVANNILGWVEVD